MGKIKITGEQFKKLMTLDESKINEDSVPPMPTVKGGGINRVNKSITKEFGKHDIQKMTEDMEDFNIKDSLPGIPNSRMKKQQEPKLPQNESLNEDIFSSEVHQAVSQFIENIWLNPSQKGLSTFFVENGITWGDIISYLTSVGILSGIGAGVYKVTNFFKRAFSKDQKEAVKQKSEDIEKMANAVAKDPKAPWNQPKKQEEPREETPLERKERWQKRPEDSGWTAEPKYNPNRFKKIYEKESESKSEKFKPIYKGKELTIVNGSDGMYVFDDSNYDKNKNITKGSGLEDFNKGIDLVKIDDELKQELSKLYEKDEEFVKSLNKKDVEEMTSTATVGAGFTGPLGAAGKPNISPDYTPAKQIEIINDEEELYGNKVSEVGQQHQKMSDKIISKISNSLNRGKKSTTDDLRAQNYEPDRTRKNYPLRNDDLPLDKFLKAKANGEIEEKTIEEDTTTVSAPGYVGPKIWAKDKANWAPAHRTQYPQGEMVDFDPCTKLNNNKAAQSGKCSQGAVDHVVKTHKTKDSVISKSMYENIAKRTGRTIEDVKRIIELKIKK